MESKEVVGEEQEEQPSTSASRHGLVQVVQPPPQQPQCSNCGTTERLLRCAKCRVVYYCSTEHQHLDWPTHKQVCRMLAKQKQMSNRVQQLTSGCGAININAHSNANIASTSQLTPSNLTSSCDTLPALDSSHLDSNAFVLGTHENEILNSKAETVSQSSMSSEYVGSFDANSTTTNQTNLMVQSNLNVTQANYDNAYYYQFNQQQAQMQIIQMQIPSQHQVQQLTMQQQLPYTPSQQHQNVFFQYSVPQHTNPIINQQERSSSHQIGAVAFSGNPYENANERYEELCRNIISDMNLYGVSVVNGFLGQDMGLQVLNEVHQMYSSGVFKDGQLVSSVKSEQAVHTIRGDKITWVKGIELECANIGYLINQIDTVICRANTMKNNGKLGNYIIKERTKAMVACYPGSGSKYVTHVDNPNKDGRVITAIYYLNLNWDSKKDGGVLRIFPEQTKTVANIDPIFDRLIFFWSDKRNPHEVQPAHKTRYAITVWYFDANEREQALIRCKSLQNTKNANISTSASSTAPADSSNIENKSSNIDTSNPSLSCTSSTISTPSSSPSTSLPLPSSTNENITASATAPQPLQSPEKSTKIVRPWVK